MLFRNLTATVFFALFTFSFFVNNSSGQTTLVAGDIAITGYISTPGPAAGDEFSFVLLRAISANTNINFTDSGWLPSPPNAAAGFRAGETFLTWTAAVAMPAGCELRITDAFAVTSIGSPGFACSNPGLLSGTALSLNGNNGDQVLAFQGPQTSPTFIAGLHSNVGTVANNGVDTTAAVWDGPLDALNTPGGGPGGTASASAKPPGLVTGTNAIWLGTQGNLASEKGNGRMRCGPSLNLSTVAGARAAINNQANWITDPPANSIPATFTLPTGCRYLDPTAAGVSVSGRVTVNGSGLRNATVVLTDSQGTPRNARTSSLGYYRFEDIPAGVTYTVSVSSKLYQFVPRVLSVSDELADVDFSAETLQ